MKTQDSLLSLCISHNRILFGDSLFRKGKEKNTKKNTIRESMKPRPERQHMVSHGVSCISTLPDIPKF